MANGSSPARTWQSRARPVYRLRLPAFSFCSRVLALASTCAKSWRVVASLASKATATHANHLLHARRNLGQRQADTQLRRPLATLLCSGAEPTESQAPRIGSKRKLANQHSPCYEVSHLFQPADFGSSSRNQHQLDVSSCLPRGTPSAVTVASTKAQTAATEAQPPGLVKGRKLSLDPAWTAARRDPRLRGPSTSQEKERLPHPRSCQLAP